MKKNLSKEIIKNYLIDKFKKKIEVLELSFIGEGYYANGYKVVYKTGDKIKTEFVRVIKPLNSGHEYPIDRALLLWTSKEIADNLKHVPKVHDVVGFDRDGNTCSISKNIEYFSIGEYVEGVKDYTGDLENIAKKKKLDPSDISRCLELSDYLAEMHKQKFVNEKSLSSL